MTSQNDLREWLVKNYPKYAVSDQPVNGTYGIIWFLKAKETNSIPRFLAVKTIDPENGIQPNFRSDVDVLRREFQMWLMLPRHRNVVPALGFESAKFPNNDGIGEISLPVMRMPKMDGSLQDWVENPSIGIEDRLIALAQSVNGLDHLYKNGFEGHGDLKPSNILYKNLGDGFILESSNFWPSKSHPWLVRIADLGWADAWVDLGFTTKALRPYLAPERLIEKRFTPIKSDMFSLGVITAELMQRCHPARNLKKAKGSEGKWVDCIEKGDWNIEQVESKRLKNLILKCLAYDPAERPTPAEFLSEISSELKEKYSQNVEPVLQLWNEEASAIVSAEYKAWGASQIDGLGTQQADKTTDELERKIDSIRVKDFETCEIWLITAGPLIKLLEKQKSSLHQAKIDHLRKTAKIYLTTVLGKIDQSKMASIVRRPDFPSQIQTFERFADVIGQAAKIAEVTYDADNQDTKLETPYAKSALAFSSASDARWGNKEGSIIEYFLSEAIRHAPEEAVPYYFRAKWRHDDLEVRYFLEKKAKLPKVDEQSPILTDLEIASRLSPEWEEPKFFRQQIQS